MSLGRDEHKKCLKPAPSSEKGAISKPGRNARICRFETSGHMGLGSKIASTSRKRTPPWVSSSDICSKTGIMAWVPPPRQPNMEGPKMVGFLTKGCPFKLWPFWLYRTWIYWWNFRGVLPERLPKIALVEGWRWVILRSEIHSKKLAINGVDKPLKKPMVPLCAIFSKKAYSIIHLWWGWNREEHRGTHFGIAMIWPFFMRHPLQWNSLGEVIQSILDPTFYPIFEVFVL